MSTVIEYLRKEVSWTWIPALVLAAACIDLCWTIPVTKIIVATSGLSLPKVTTTIWPFFVGAIPMAIQEEVVFRGSLSISIFNGWGDRATLDLLIISSVIFGVMHGSVYNIFLQGFVGITLGIVYLKCGGMQGKLFKPLCASSATHICFNIFLFVMAPLTIQ